MTDTDAAQAASGARGSEENCPGLPRSLGSPGLPIEEARVAADLRRRTQMKATAAANERNDAKNRESGLKLVCLLRHSFPGLLN